MQDVIRELGAFAGIAAFIGLAVLALLYFAQARDVRRLRENAEFLLDEDADVPEAPAPIGAEAAAEARGEAATQARGQAPVSDAEAFRRAELQHQAKKRRERFEERREGGGGRDIFSTAVIVVGAVILLAGIVFGATRLLGGGDGGGGGGGGDKAPLACKPGDTDVAVLNATAESGLAAGFAEELETKGYVVGPITNTESGFEASVLMFAKGAQQCAPEIGEVVGVQASEPMDSEIQGISEGADVAVVLGEDKASGGAAADSTATDSSGI
ncbi:MAG: LytR family transcriptional regulator [Actinobacteria bacterium]|nr:LytR family transcriptional regulator [Actinomycetota bacterium]